MEGVKISFRSCGTSGLVDWSTLHHFFRKVKSFTSIPVYANDNECRGISRVILALERCRNVAMPPWCCGLHRSSLVYQPKEGYQLAPLFCCATLCYTDSAID